MKLNKEQVQYIANLARLDLTKNEIEKLGGELSGILDYIDQLQKVDTTDVLPTAQVSGLENVVREDISENWDEAEIKNALDQAPELENGQIKVKKII